MSEIEPGLENTATTGERPPVAVREGLPPAYRMRADQHYVEELDALPSSPPVRLIDTRTIEVRGEEPKPAASFVDSIKRHGILQPILVQTRGGRYRLIAGRKRLAAAMAAGIREVPCIVQRVDEEQAGLMAEATNLPAQDLPAAPGQVTRPAVETSATAGATEQLAQSLLALASSANLLSGGSPLTAAVAVDLVKAEAARALQLLLASRVLRNEVPVTRMKVQARTIVDRAMQMTMAERRLRGSEVVVSAEGLRDSAVRGDEELLASAVAGLVMAAVGVVGDRGGPVTLSAAGRNDGRLVFTVSQESLSVPESWVERTFDAAWPLATGSTGTLALMQSARRIAELHGGHAVAASTEAGTTFSITLPLVAREM